MSSAPWRLRRRRAGGFLTDLPPPAAVVPLAVWTVFDLVMAVVQAYIFAILTATYYNLALSNASVGQTASIGAAS